MEKQAAIFRIQSGCGQ